MLCKQLSVCSNVKFCLSEFYMELFPQIIWQLIEFSDMKSAVIEIWNKILLFTTTRMDFEGIVLI